MVVRLAGMFVPDHRRLTLVGDAHADEVARRERRFGERVGHHLLRLGPDVQRVVLDVARLRVELVDLNLVRGHDGALMVHDHEPRRGRALVDRADKLGAHGGGGLGSRL